MFCYANRKSICKVALQMMYGLMYSYFDGRNCDICCMAHSIGNKKNLKKSSIPCLTDTLTWLILIFQHNIYISKGTILMINNFNKNNNYNKLHKWK